MGAKESIVREVGNVNKGCYIYLLNIGKDDGFYSERGRISSDRNYVSVSKKVKLEEVEITILF
jgi:hypothetical protein